MIYATGDTHANFQRFNMEIFPEQKEMDRNDLVLIAGDFGGIWAQTSPHSLRPESDRQRILKEENGRLDSLQEKNCTFCYVLGNHENWNRYDGDEFETVDFYGGKAHRIRENVYHLMSGYVFDFDGYKVYAFGGAGSHDISDGISALSKAYLHGPYQPVKQPIPSTHLRKDPERKHPYMLQTSTAEFVGNFHL